MSKRISPGSVHACRFSCCGMAEPQTVTVGNFVRAETDGYAVKNSNNGQLGVLHHGRNVVGVDNQSVIRMNRDTLYSSAVIDLTTPVTITLPDAGDRFRSMLVINQDHYVKGIEYAAGDYTLTQDQIGTRYVHVFIRHFIDANDPADLARPMPCRMRSRSTRKAPARWSFPIGTAPRAIPSVAF
jgi:hypothetical protein